MPDDMSPEDSQRAQILLSRERRRNDMRPILEERDCAGWGIPYDEANPETHRVELEKRNLYRRTAYDNFTRHTRFLGFAGRAAGAAGKSGGQKLMDWVIGAAILYALHWLAKKAGINVAGLIP